MVFLAVLVMMRARLLLRSTVLRQARGGSDPPECRVDARADWPLRFRDRVAPAFLRIAPHHEQVTSAEGDTLRRLRRIMPVAEMHRPFRAETERRDHRLL